MALHEGWMDDFTYATRTYNKRMKKYCDYFSKIFRCELATFGYERTTHDGYTTGISNTPQMGELYLKTEGYKDNPFFVQHDKTIAGFIFIHPQYDERDAYNNLYRNALCSINLHTTFAILEKCEEYAHDFAWTFRRPPSCINIDREKSIILQDFLNNMRIIKLCLEQFKEEFFPIITEEQLCKINLHDLSLVYSKGHSVLEGNDIPLDYRKLLRANIIDEQDIHLLQTSLTNKEHECLKLYLDGMITTEIASNLSLSPRTIEKHISNIKGKLLCTSRSEVYSKAFKMKTLHNYYTNGKKEDIIL